MAEKVSGRTSTRKVELLVAGASDLSARVKNLIALKLQADNIFISTHAFDACVAKQRLKLCNFHQILQKKYVLLKGKCTIIMI